MEVFATLGVILLVGLAFPIVLIFGALMFDLGLVLYVVIATKWSHHRKRQSFEARAGGARDRKRQYRIAWATRG